MGLGPETLLYEALIPSLEEVGARFERGDFFVPEMLIAGKAMAGALEVLRPLLAETGAEPIGTFVMGTVKGDVHDIGKNLVNIMLEGAGFQVIDLGVQVAPEKFIDAIKEHKPDIVGFSAFLTTTMPMFKANINALQKAGLRDKVIVMVGGAPVTQEYADAVGADGYAADASAAVVRAKELIKRRRAAGRPEARARSSTACYVHTVLKSATREVVIGPDQPFCIIGERINPTGRKIFQEQLRRGDLSRIEIDVAQQVAGGAMVLDVNMGVPLADEAELMAAAVTADPGLTDLPLCIDSSVVEALEAGLAAYQGKALVNSVTAEDERLERILPLVKKYGAAVIALPNDEEEIPEDPRRRLELARKIIDVATGQYGIPIEDIVIDPLAMPIGADTSLVVKTLETIALLRDEFGVNMTLGASNVSFGMPDRHAIGAAFLPMAMTAGLTSAIMDARSPQIVRAVQAADLLLDRDPWGAAWIAAHRASSRPAGATGPAAEPPGVDGRARRREGRQLRPARPSGAREGSTAPGRVDLIFPDRARRVRVPPGVTVFDAASWNGIAIDSTCGGHGTCKKCKVRVIDGAVPVTALDIRAFTPTSCADGWRLACRVLAETDARSRCPPLTTRPKAATVGVGRQVILRPAVQKRYVELDRAVAGRPDAPTWSGCWPRSTTSSCGWTCTRCDRAGCCAPPTTRSPR